MKISELTLLSDEQQHLMDFKIRESRLLLTSIKNPYSRRKIEHLLNEFNPELKREIYDKHGCSLGSIKAGDLESQGFGGGSVRDDDVHDFDKGDPVYADPWDVEKIEKEMIRHAHNQYRIKNMLNRARVLHLTATDKLNDKETAAKIGWLQLAFQKYLRIPLIILGLIVFFAISLVLGYLLVVNFFGQNRERQKMHVILQQANIVQYVMVFPVFISLFFGLLVTGILDTRLGYFGGLFRNNLTDVWSINYLVGNISRIMIPFCLNVFSIYNLGFKAQFFSIILNTHVLGIMVEKVNRYYPALLLLLIVLKCLNCYKRFRRCFGFESFQIGDNMSRSEHRERGRQLVDKFLNSDEC